MRELKGTRQPSGELVGRVVIPSSTGGATEWGELLNKPFETIGDNLGVTPDQSLYAKVPIAESLTNSEIEELLK
jgi:hypothetical protein|nr:MAG TPA: hypothetical protein [Caudoviricetes sp.]